MNETELIFTTIIAFAVGYGIAYFAKNIGDLTHRWGIFCIFLFPTVFIILFGGGAFIADLNNIGLSLCFLIGFIIRLARRA